MQSFGAAQWIAALCLGAFGGAAAFYLWVFALERTTPTRVANTMTANPVAASLLAAVLVGEPLGVNLLVGICAVGVGIWIASTDGQRSSVADTGPTLDQTSGSGLGFTISSNSSAGTVSGSSLTSEPSNRS